MPEKTFERKHAQWVREELGGFSLKLNDTVGWPDRLVLLPKATIFFVEFKSPGEEPRAIQRHVHGLLRRLGFTVYVWQSYAEAHGGTLRHIGGLPS